MSESTIVSEADVFSDLVNAGIGGFDPDAARAVLRLRFSPAQNARMLELAERNNQGELTDRERAEMENYRRVGNFLTLIHSRARVSLKQDR